MLYSNSSKATLWRMSTQIRVHTRQIMAHIRELMRNCMSRMLRTDVGLRGEKVWFEGRFSLLKALDKSKLVAKSVATVIVKDFLFQTTDIVQTT
jgi:hypothetical protein